MTVELQEMFDKINSLLDELSYHPKHVAASVKDHLGDDVERLEDCRDMDKLKLYHTYLTEKLAAEWEKDAEANPADEDQHEEEENESPLPA